MSVATAWLRGVVESATPGEWRAEVRTMEVAPGSGDFYSLVGIMPAEHFVGDAERAEPDARAIAALHNVAPAAVAVIAAAERAVDECSETLDNMPSVEAIEALDAAVRHYRDVCARVRACMEASHA